MSYEAVFRRGPRFVFSTTFISLDVEDRRCAFRGWE